MSVYAVVPVKATIKSKARLSTVLNPQERQTLTLTMLEDVLKALKSSSVYQIGVISSDLTVQALTNKFEAVFLSESQRGLNQAVEQATEWCNQNKAESVLILPADIPLITTEDINQIVKLGSEETSVVISPSLNWGTNALLQKPPRLMPARYGPYSFKKHVDEASAKGVAAKIYNSPRITIDIDSLEDLKGFLKVESQTVSQRFLKQIRVQERLDLQNY